MCYCISAQNTENSTNTISTGCIEKVTKEIMHSMPNYPVFDEDASLQYRIATNEIQDRLDSGNKVETHSSKSETPTGHSLHNYKSSLQPRSVHLKKHFRYNLNSELSERIYTEIQFTKPIILTSQRKKVSHFSFE